MNDKDYMDYYVIPPYALIDTKLIKFIRDDEEAVIPTQATSGSAGWDVYAPHNFMVGRDLVTLVDLGFKVEIPKGYYLSIVPRSSMAKKGVIIPNAPATIDSDYRGNIGVMFAGIINTNIVVNKGDRIAQLILHRYHGIKFEEVSELSNTDRGSGGFGSTGR